MKLFYPADDLFLENPDSDSAWRVSNIPVLTVCRDIQYCTGRAPWQPTHTTFTLQQWWNCSWTHWPLSPKWEKGSTAALFIQRDEYCIQYIQSNVFNHIHMVNLYTSLCPLAYTVPLWEFSSAVIIMAVSPHPCTPHTPHSLHGFKWLLSPWGPNLTVLHS